MLRVTSQVSEIFSQIVAVSSGILMVATFVDAGLGSSSRYLFQMKPELSPACLCSIFVRFSLTSLVPATGIQTQRSSSKLRDEQRGAEHR